jgi:hypothetical protein
MSLKQDLKINELDERWVHFTLHSTDDIIKKYGIKYFVDNLSRYSKIALSDYYRKLQEKNDEKET